MMPIRIPHPLFFSAALALFSATLAVAEKTRGLSSWALKAWNETDGPAAASIFEYAKRTIIPCYERDHETKCPLASRTDSVNVFYSRPYEAPDYAFAVISYNPDTGNALWFDASIFRKTAKGSYTRLRGVDGLIGPVESATLNDESFIVTTSTLTPNDARCCPSGHTVWRISIADGQAHYQSGYKSAEWRLGK